jgi:hypothetical protein
MAGITAGPVIAVMEDEQTIGYGAPIGEFPGDTVRSGFFTKAIVPEAPVATIFLAKSLPFPAFELPGFPDISPETHFERYQAATYRTDHGFNRPHSPQAVN